MFLWMAWHSRQIVIADTYISSSNLAVSVEQFVARTIDTIDLSMRVAMEEISVGGAKPPGEAQALLAERVRQSPQITSLVVLGRDGRVRYSSMPLPASARDMSRKSFFTAARDSDTMRFTVGEPLTSDFRDKRVVFASERLDRPDGDFAGVIVAVLNSDYMLKFFYTLNVGEQGIIAFETVDGTLLVRRPYRDGYVGKDFSWSPLFKSMLPWASSGVFPMQYRADGLWRIVGYQRIEKLPLVVQVALSQDEALANWHRTTVVQAAVAIAILLVLCAMAFALNRQLRARMRAHEQLRETVGELETARAKAEESSRVKSQFMANMSHELRTPLNAIIGFSEVIRDAIMGPLPTRYRDYARDIHSSGTHLLHLIAEVLDLSKIEVGRLELHEEPVDLAKMIGDCHRLIAERAKSGELEVTVELPAKLPVVRGDELRLKQIILNLLSNAVKFTPPGGRVTLSIAPTAEGGVALTVSDTGIGMKPEEIPIALQPFRQLDSALNRRYEGTGLGLPLAQRLAELHGGTLTIDSAAGGGTQVAVKLPPARVVSRAA